jgi:hypothetical protein
MAFLTREARMAQMLDTVRGRFLEHLGDNLDAEMVDLADTGAQLAVKVATLEAKAERDGLTEDEAIALVHGRRLLDAVKRRLGIERAPRRGQSLGPSPNR